MNTRYAKGYRNGWLSYMEASLTPKQTLKILAMQADSVAEQASHGLLPQDDFWLGYHHGRHAAEFCATRYLESLSVSSAQL
jgi:hypothetical protein